MIILKGLMDVHPFDGSSRGLFVLAQGPVGEFRLPVTEEQASILIQQFGGPTKEDPPSQTPAPSVPAPPRPDLDSTMVVDGSHGMGAADWSFSNEYDDGDL
jgi:hypothetical protein